VEKKKKKTKKSKRICSEVRVNSPESRGVSREEEKRKTTVGKERQKRKKERKERKF